MSEIKPRSYVSAQMVADRAGVSRSAVSRTFTNGASVSPATRSKVMRAADELGYQVNHLARGLIQDRSNIVSLLVADLTTPLRARMVDALSRGLQAVDKVALVINTTESDPMGVSMALHKSLQYRADATIVLSGTPPAALVETCTANGQRVVLINRDDQVEGSENLSVDNAVAAREACFLLRRAGCSRLMLVSSEAGTPSLVEREEVFLATTAAAGATASVIRVGPTAYESGAEAARRVFARSDSPDGVFCVTDLLALGFMDVARHEFGMRIPEDLCVVGFDDIEQAGWDSYRLTTYRQPVEQMAAHVVQMLVDSAPPASGRIQFQPVPVWRKSVRPSAVS